MLHFSESRESAAVILRAALGRGEVQRAVLVEDLFLRIRLIVWAPREGAIAKLTADLGEGLGPYWSGDIWIADAAPGPDREVYETTWREADEIEPRLRRSVRFRSRGFWLRPPSDPLWPIADDYPPVIAFYSFKGGMGRTTGLVSFAIQRARRGERIVVLDLDLDAPGIHRLFDADLPGPAIRWGVVDYMLESRVVSDVDLQDYYHVYARESVTGPGEVYVFRAGTLDQQYLAMLARLDLEPPRFGEHHPLQMLLDRIRVDLRPNWILIDARAGLSEASGFVLGGLAHLYMLLGSNSEQSWGGLRLVIERLGAMRLREGRAQGECLLVHAMVPADPETGRRAKADFAATASDDFAELYYAENPADSDEDRFWYVRDADMDDAPHVPVALSYNPALAFIRHLDEVASVLDEGPEYRALGERIASRFAREEQ
ncbi:MAG: hypothetical protein HYR60_21170 [Acidobacteria bacterium]|nr:hypothetical protein [Acidobacteriota bacterium]